MATINEKFMKVCTDCKKTEQCGIELDAKLDGMDIAIRILQNM